MFTDYKKAQNELKRASGEAIRLKKKINKGILPIQNLIVHIIVEGLGVKKLF